MNDATAIALLLEDLEDSEGLYECYGETYAQYQAEMNHYGDAWPGSFDQISRMQDAIAEVERTSALIDAISPPWRNPYIDYAWAAQITGCEEPF